ncbi:MAG: hypothetical protein JO270_18425 [Acidobacteriaceae bacterium]|nr:hypothetical protein [Acidobacteriaceae bacterium]
MTTLWLIAMVSCAPVIVGSAVCVFLYRSLKLQIRKAGAYSASREELRSEVAKLQAQLEETRTALSKLEKVRSSSEEWAPEGVGAQINSHGQVLKLHQRGESAAAIASALRLPMGEVSLIVKVFEMSQNFPTARGGQKGF